MSNKIPVKIQVKSSGHSFTTQQNETILDAALRQGYIFPYGCRNGVCGSCKGKLLAGKVTYAQDPSSTLDQAEQAANMALFCQAIPLEDLIIDIQELNCRS